MMRGGCSHTHVLEVLGVLEKMISGLLSLCFCPPSQLTSVNLSLSTADMTMYTYDTNAHMYVHAQHMHVTCTTHVTCTHYCTALSLTMLQQFLLHNEV